MTAIPNRRGNRDGARAPEDAGDAMLWSAVGRSELDLIHRADRRAWPRLPGEPVFHPVLDEEYAVRIAVEWHVARDGIGYVTRFHVDPVLFERYPLRPVADRSVRELHVPAVELAEFNAHILGRIEVAHELRYC